MLSLMAQLIVRKLNTRLVQRLKRRAAEHGVSMEEEHRRLVRAGLEAEKKPKMSFKEQLLGPPYVELSLLGCTLKRGKRHRKIGTWWCEAFLLQTNIVL